MRYKGKVSRDLTIYAPMIYTAPCVRFLMRADRLRGEGGEGLALEISSFVGPCEIARAERRVLFGAQSYKIYFEVYKIKSILSVR
jgi:hypothetical protein